MDKIIRKEILILILCFIVGFALRFYTFDQKSLWMDEIYTFNDSRYDLKNQISFYKDYPTFLHPPLFFILTHLFYPFTTPERDLRIIPLIFGTLAIPMMYLLSRSFAPNIALPCTLSLTFMAYHISLSQDGRSYSFLLFLGIAALYFFMKHLITSKQRYLLLVALFFALSFHTSYSSIPFIALSQILWFYRSKENETLSLKQTFHSFLILNGLLLLLCLPWLLFLAMNYKGDALMDPIHTENPGSLWSIIYGVFNDWVPHAPLMIASAILFILLPFFSKNQKNAIILLALFILPVAGLSLFCKFFNVTHFITSRYFINFIPLFFISIFLSLSNLETRFERLKKSLRLKPLFVILFIASNLVILPFYYRAEKEDKRGLANYLKVHLREGDKIIVSSISDISALLHYFGINPTYRHYIIPFYKFPNGEEEYRISFIYRNTVFTIHRPKTCCGQYIADGGRLWIVVRKQTAKIFQESSSPIVLKGYFDGSFLNYIRFPVDASIYLFLLDPQSPNEKGIDLPIE